MSSHPWPDIDDDARWRHLARNLVGRQIGGSTVTRLNLRWAQRIVHGLPLIAADREVAVIQASITDRAAERALVLAYLAAFDRLAAGELPTVVEADTTTIPGDPAWRILSSPPPASCRIDDLAPGDIIRGSYAHGPDSYLDREFCGPLLSRPEPVTRDQHGARHVVVLADNLVGTFASDAWFAAYHLTP